MAIASIVIAKIGFVLARAPKSVIYLTRVCRNIMLELWRMHLSSSMHKSIYQLVVIEFLLWFHMRNQYEYNLHVQSNYELEVF